MKFQEFINILKYKKALIHQLYLKRIAIKSFHRLFYEFQNIHNTWSNNTFWLGIPIHKCPLDCWIYQEIIFETKPDIIIETGSANGGSALFLAFICDLINKGSILSIDIQARERPEHKRIKYLTGSSISEEIIKQVKDLIKNENKIMVILDSDHSKEYVYNELKIYSSL